MTSAASDRDSSYKVAYDEGVRALSQQQSQIDSFRTRAGLLLSAAAITTSFLGAQALNDGGPGAATWLALTAFVGLSTAALAILWPHRWEFTADPENLIDTYIETENPASVSEIHRDLSLHMHHSYVENRTGRQQLATCFQLACVLLTVEVILWVRDLASRA
ncbi:MAG: hypothetical protein ACRDQZ_17115 [Mycobacteriales bacterium]